MRCSDSRMISAHDIVEPLWLHVTFSGGLRPGGVHCLHRPVKRESRSSQEVGLFAIRYWVLAICSIFNPLSQRRLLSLLLLAGFAGLFFFPALISLLTDWWWFKEIGYQVVFTRELVTRLLLFLVAGGSGIVPLMAMIRSRALAGSTAPFRLLYSVREPQAVFYREELQALSDHDRSMNLTYAYTRVAPKDWPRPPSRIDAALIANTTWPSKLVPTCYVCGPTSFVESASRLLTSSGNDPEKIRTERFGPTGERQ